MTNVPQQHIPEHWSHEMMRFQIPRNVINTYTAAIRKLNLGEQLPFDPREVSIEGIIDVFQPDHFVGITVANADEFEKLQYVDEMAPPTTEQMEAAVKLYAAMLLGLPHSSVTYSKATGMIGSYFDITDSQHIPKLPKALQDGTFETNDAEHYTFGLNDILADSIFAGHWIVENRVFSGNPDQIKVLIQQITAQADQGNIVVADTGGNIQGFKSLVRQIAHSVGYVVDNQGYIEQDGSFVLAIHGSRPGFSNVSHAKNNTVEESSKGNTRNNIVVALGSTAI